MIVFVALDGLSAREEETLQTAARLSEQEGGFGFKVNLDYLLSPGKTVEEKLSPFIQLGRPVFADLKMWNGSRTMASVARNMVDLGVDYINAYVLADDMIQPTIQVVHSKDSQTRLLGLTVLSHYDDHYCWVKFSRALQDTVSDLGRAAAMLGFDGIILPGTALEVVEDLDLMKVVPGIRPEWYQDDRHKEAVTPREAVSKGADALVIGSPIMKVPNPISSLRRILQQIE